MKGITPVIAIILLLLITISMVGFAFVWFSRVTSSAGQQIENQTLQQIGAANKKMSIDGVNPSPNPTSVYLKNIGSANVNRAEISVYVNNLLATCTWTGADPIPPGTVVTCSFAPTTCSSGQTLRITSPGTQDIVTCP